MSERYARARAQREKTVAYRSGFCGLRNSADSHARCPLAYRGRPCVCSCHESPPAPGFHDDIPEATYHAHEDSLSHSGAKLILKAPALYLWERTHPTHKDVWDFGSAAHALVLGRGQESIYVAPFDSWQTKQAQLEKELARAQGLSPILPKDWLVVCDMAERISQHRLAMELLSEGRPEVSAFAVDEPTGILRRCRFDWLGSSILSDYKSAASSDPARFARAAADLGYDSQDAWYLDMARDLGHPAAAFAFIVQEKTAPYLVSVVELDSDFRARGRRRNREALERFRDCVEADSWPGYVPDDEFATVSMPKWAAYEEAAAW